MGYLSSLYIFHFRWLVCKSKDYNKSLSILRQAQVFKYCFHNIIICTFAEFIIALLFILWNIFIHRLIIQFYLEPVILLFYIMFRIKYKLLTRIFTPWFLKLLFIEKWASFLPATFSMFSYNLVKKLKFNRAMFFVAPIFCYILYFWPVCLVASKAETLENRMFQCSSLLLPLNLLKRQSENSCHFKGENLVYSSSNIVSLLMLAERNSLATSCHLSCRILLHHSTSHMESIWKWLHTCYSLFLVVISYRDW